MKMTKAAVARLGLADGKSELIAFDDDLPGFGVRVRAGGKRTWIAQYRLGRQQRRLSLGTLETVDIEEARRRAKTALARVSLGEDPATAKADAKAQTAVTLASVLPGYLAYAALRHRASHHDDVRRYFSKHWAPLAKLPLASLSRARVSARLLELSSENGPYAAARARAALSAFFTWAVAEGLSEVNPVEGTNKPAPEVTRDRVLSDEELALVWREVGQGDFGAIVRLLILTACRREEVAAMAWSELEGSTWTIPAARSKNGRQHTLDLSQAAMSVLDGVERRDGRDLVFGSRSGPFSGWSKAKAELDGRVTRARKARGGVQVDVPPWRIHDLRRTTATRMADMGVQPHVVEAVLNHVSGSKAGVAGVYNRAAYQAEKRAALTLWADRVAEITQ